MKKVFITLLGLVAVSPLVADEELANGYNWTYRIVGDMAEIYGIRSGSSYVPSIPASSTGDVCIPSTLGGYPVKSIGSHAFTDCYRITGVSIPESVTNIASYAFENCHAITSVTIPDSVISVRSSAFINCSIITATIPQCVCSSRVKSILPGVVNVIVSQGVASIESFAFQDCRKLTNVIIPGSVTNISEFAFDRCGSLESIEIPGSVKSVGDCVFFDCTNLVSVSLGEGVLSIGQQAFKNCSQLVSVTMPSSITNIGWNAFYGCSAVKNVRIPDLAAWCKIRFADCFANPIYYSHGLYLNDKRLGNLTIPDGVTRIGHYAFYNCSNVNTRQLVIPDSVMSIGDSAFYGCSRLTSATIGDGVTNIAGYAFYNCSRLTSVTIGSGVKSVGSYAFYGCSDALYDTTTISGVRLVDGWVIGYSEQLSGVLNLTGARGVSGGAFRDCDKLTGVVLPNCIASIGPATFSGCSGLTSVTMPEGVTSIGSSAFSGCSSLGCVTIPNSVRSIGADAFEGCGARLYDEATIPGVKLVDGWVVGHGQITGGLDLKGIRGIAAGAFSYCSGLTYITIPDGVVNIEDSTFYECGLVSISIPSSVTKICDKAFYDCRNLKTVKVGSGVASIGNSAFNSCIGLTNIMFIGNAPILGNNAFQGASVHCIVCVMRTSSGWDVEIPGRWNGMGIEYLPDVILPLDGGSSASTITAAIDSAGFADPGVKTAIGGSAVEYGKFKTWAGSVMGVSGTDIAGEAAVVASTNAAAAYLLGAERLFENQPKIELGKLSVGDEGIKWSLTFSVTVKDGEDIVKCTAEKVKKLFEATSSLDDWTGDAKLIPTTNVLDSDGDSLRFKVTPGDGTAPSAFLRIRCNALKSDK